MRDGVAYKATGEQLSAVMEDLMLAKSLRFRGDTRDSNKPYLVRVPAVEGNRKTWTFSAWIKRGQLSTNQTFLDAFGPSDELYHLLRFNTANQITHTIQNVGTLTTAGKITQYDRWKHIVVAYDSTQAVESDRVKIYIDNVKQTLTGTYPELNHVGNVNSTQQHNIGRYINGSSQCFDGLMASVTFVDGKALTPSSFGNISKDGQNRWNPKKYSNVGPNGYYLNFEDISSTTALGKDSSGNENNWSTSGFSLTLNTKNYDSFYDVPTPTNERSGNYAILSQTDAYMTGNGLGKNPWPLQGNVQDCNLGVRAYSRYVNNLGKQDKFYVTSRCNAEMKTSGKYYWEISCHSNGVPTASASSLGYHRHGVMGSTAILTDNNPNGPGSQPVGENSGAFGYYNGAPNKRWYHNQFSTYPSHSSAEQAWKMPSNNVFPFGYDAATRKIYLGTFNSSALKQMPMTGWSTNNNGGGGTPPMPSIMKAALCIASSSPDGTAHWYINFGQQPFKFPIPAGFKTLNSFNNAALRL